MPQITIDNDTHQRLKLAARVAGVNIADVIRILTNEGQIDRSLTPSEVDSRWVAIYSSYKNSNITAEFNRNTGAIRITSGKLDGKEFSAPSSAAIAVVQSVNPGREDPHTNGWRFWKDKRTRRSLDAEFERPG